MGNVPAKITGKYQSYDINNPEMLTPSMQKTRRNDEATAKVNNFIDEHTESDNFSKNNRSNIINDKKTIGHNETDDDYMKSSDEINSIGK